MNYSKKEVPVAQLYYRSDGTTCRLEWDEDEEEEIEVEIDTHGPQVMKLQYIFYAIVLFIIIF
jgi:hypothetical protein